VEEVLLFNIFFQIVDICLICEYMTRQNCAMVPRLRIFGEFLRPAFPASRVQHVSDLHPKFTLRPHHVRSMVDIQSATAENRRRKKKKIEEETTGQNIMSASATQGGHKQY